MTSGSNGTVAERTHEVLRYAAEVRAELADLTPGQRDDLLEDLEDHLSEVAAELDEPLTARLGPPVAYAAELRASAGLAPAATRPTPVSRGRQLLNTDAFRSVRSFLVELQPAWWVLRGMLLAVILLPLFGPFAVLVFGIPAIVISVLLGRRTRGRRGPWVLAALGNVVAVVVALYVLAAVAIGTTTSYEEPSSFSGPLPHLGGVLQHEDGTPITNIFPYDAQGQPLSGVRLFDQDGRPITNVSNFTEDGRPIERTYPVEPNGLRVRNAYPQELTIVDEFGRPTKVPVVPPTPSASVTSGG